MQDIRTRDSDSVIRILITASMTMLMAQPRIAARQSGTTSRILMYLNDDVVKDMKKMSTLKDKLTVAVDWHVLWRPSCGRRRGH